MNNMKYIEVISSAECTGCRSCEVACSFHHSGAFGLSNSSITVRRDDQSGEIALSLASDCDGCRGETIPLCIKFCRREVLAQVAPQPNG